MIEEGTAGHRPMVVAAHTVRNHQDANVVRNRQCTRSRHVFSQDPVFNSDAIFVCRANPAAMGKGSGMPGEHKIDPAMWELEDGSLTDVLFGGDRQFPASVSVRRVLESSESSVIQEWWPDSRRGHRCGRARTAPVTTAASCDIRAI